MKIKQIILLGLYIVFSITQGFAQNDTIQALSAQSHKQEIKEYRQSVGEIYEGLTKKLSFDRMIPPYELEVTFEKTVHIIFPATIKYVDLGSPNIIAGKAGDADNVLRVKAAIKDFKGQTNFSVITEEGSFYSFNVRYSHEPQKLNIEMKDFMHDGLAVNRANNAMEIYLRELAGESPKLVHMIMRSIHKENKRIVKHIGCKRFGIQYLLKGIYSHNNMLYLHTQLKNSSHVSLQVDFVRMKIVDKQLAKRTAIQETLVVPVRAYNNVQVIAGKATECTVYAIEKITIPDDKKLVVELYEKDGGRSQSFTIENSDLVRAQKISGLKLH